jgi:hypothetical protein
MSAVLSAPLSAKKPIEALFAEICDLVAILRETRRALGFAEHIGVRELVELQLREQNCVHLLRGLRAAAIFELQSVEDVTP